MRCEILLVGIADARCILCLSGAPCCSSLALTPCVERKAMSFWSMSRAVSRHLVVGCSCTFSTFPSGLVTQIGDLSFDREPLCRQVSQLCTPKEARRRNNGHLAQMILQLWDSFEDQNFNMDSIVTRYSLSFLSGLRLPSCLGTSPCQGHATCSGVVGDCVQQTVQHSVFWLF